MKNIIFTVIVFVSGCMTTEQEADYDLALWGPYCQRLGFLSGTTEYIQCVQTQAISSESSRASAAAALLNKQRHCTTFNGAMQCY